jgi:site-specific DNA recombinase
MTSKQIRCAIYTRKSTEEGLDKEFNTLEAQREACEAYIKSQLHEGWTLIPTHYDDGGYTGGNMERPALKALMADIKAGKVDVIVVYKVDRLSRSLHDFAQMVAVFDSNNVSFVSITQQFNTTTSMGRLTLNILLSFAQFEREVIGERVRDKVAASKKKGMWMGGHPPLGYDIEHRKLVINPEEAELTRKIFQHYIEFQSGYRLAIFLNENGYTNKRWLTKRGVESGGQQFTYQALYKILNNQIYIGQIRHKENTYDGQHEAIISNELWEQTQELLRSGIERRADRNIKQGYLLTGKCFNPSSQIYTPTYTTKNKRNHYRYYLQKDSSNRIKAPDLEGLVFDTIRTLSNHPEHWRLCWKNKENRLTAEEAQHRWESLWQNWPQLNAEVQLDVAQKILEKVIIAKDMLRIRLSYTGIYEALAMENYSGDSQENIGGSGFVPNVTIEKDFMEIAIAVRFRVYGRTQVAFGADGKPLQAVRKSKHNPTLVNALVKSYRWNRMLGQGKTTITDLAAKAGVSRTYVSRIVNLMYMAPDIITAIMNGTQPVTLQLKDLLQNLPVEWDGQRNIFENQML